MSGTTLAALREGVARGVATLRIGPFMDEPVRVRLSRAKGWRMPPNTVKVDRTTRWGNPFVPDRPAPFGPAKGTIVKDAPHAYALYRAYALGDDALRADARRLLKGRNLACWCRQNEGGEDHCHAAVLLALANGHDDDDAR